MSPEAGAVVKAVTVNVGVAPDVLAVMFEACPRNAVVAVVPSKMTIRPWN